MKKIWRYMNYDMVDTCIESALFIFLLRLILDGVGDHNIAMVGAVVFGIIYCAGTMHRMGTAKDLMNEYIEDWDTRRRLGLNSYNNRHDPRIVSLVAWIFFALWTGIIFFAVIIKGGL